MQNTTLAPVAGVPYTRSEIATLVGGGELQSYLPQKDRKILAGCFSRYLNPDAPLLIQVGTADIVVRKAKLLASQPETVFPVFIKDKKSDRVYFYEGYFRIGNLLDLPEVIQAAEQRSGRHGELTCVIELVPVSP